MRPRLSQNTKHATSKSTRPRKLPPIKWRSSVRNGDAQASTKVLRRWQHARVAQSGRAEAWKTSRRRFESGPVFRGPWRTLRRGPPYSCSRNTWPGGNRWLGYRVRRANTVPQSESRHPVHCSALTHNPRSFPAGRDRQEARDRVDRNGDPDPLLHKLVNLRGRYGLLGLSQDLQHGLLNHPHPRPRRSMIRPNRLTGLATEPAQSAHCRP